jgi:hypothetical protein
MPRHGFLSAHVQYQAWRQDIARQFAALIKTAKAL